MWLGLGAGGSVVGCAAVAVLLLVFARGKTPAPAVLADTTSTSPVAERPTSERPTPPPAVQPSSTAATSKDNLPTQEATAPAAPALPSLTLPPVDEVTERRETPAQPVTPPEWQAAPHEPQPVASTIPPPAGRKTALSEPVEEEEERPATVVRTPSGANGEKIYQYLLKSTTLLIRPLVRPDGRVGMVMGSGSLIDRTNRLVLTNYHVTGDSDRMSVFFPTYKDGKLVAEQDYFFKQAKDRDALQGKVVFRDPRVDLAVLQLDRLPEDVQALPFAGTRPTPGMPVYSVGHPGRSGGLWVYTEGKVRQLLHKKWNAGGGEAVLHCDAEVVLTDSPTNPGDSGGPLVNSRGELVAVVHGGDPASNLMALFIDLSEVKGVLDRYSQGSGVQLALETSSSLGSEEDSSSLPDLVRALGHRQPSVRAQAARALGSLGGNARIAIAALLKALNDDDALVRRLALQALNRIGTPAPEDAPLLLAALKEANPEVRRYAAGALGQLGPAAHSGVAPLIAALDDRDAGVRQRAARALGKLGPDVKDQVRPALMQTLNDEDAEVRGAAAEGLASLPLDAADVGPLRKLLKHEEAEVRVQAAHALCKIGPEARGAVRSLEEALQDHNSRVRQAALEGLAGIGADAADAIQDVERLLKDSSKDVRRAAVDTLGALGPDAKVAAKSLADCLQDADLRRNALTALGKIGPGAAHDALPALAALLAGPEKEERLLVLATVGALKPSGPEARDILSKILALFEERDPAVCDKAVETLGKMGKAAVPALRNALGDPTRNVRLGAALALGEIGAGARDARQILSIHAQADEDADVREACLKAVSKMQR